MSRRPILDGLTATQRYEARHGDERRAAAVRKRALDPEGARAQERARYAANPERYRTKAREWYRANPDKVQSDPVYAKAWREANLERIRELDRERSRDPRRKAQVNLGRANLNARRLGLPDAAARVGPCELCGRVESRSWDHDHKSGLFRGWLCSRCNLVLGRVEDDGELLAAMSEYVSRRLLKVVS